MPKGYPHSKSTRRELFDRVCRGVPLDRAARDMGVSTTAATLWWRDAGAMKLLRGQNAHGTHGLAEPGDPDRPGGRGHRLSLGERIEIMRGRDNKLNAQIGDQIGRDGRVVWREVNRNANPDGDYHAGMAHARATQTAKRPKGLTLDDPCCAPRSRRGWMTGGAPG